jgi:hypothetical protein
MACLPGWRITHSTSTALGLPACCVPHTHVHLSRHRPAAATNLSSPPNRRRHAGGGAAAAPSRAPHPSTSAASLRSRSTQAPQSWVGCCFSANARRQGVSRRVGGPCRNGATHTPLDACPVHPSSYTPTHTAARAASAVGLAAAAAAAAANGGLRMAGLPLPGGAAGAAAGDATGEAEQAPPLPRENAVLVLGGTGKLGRRIVAKVGTRARVRVRARVLCAAASQPARRAHARHAMRAVLRTSTSHPCRCLDRAVVRCACAPPPSSSCVRGARSWWPRAARTRRQRCWAQRRACGRATRRQQQAAAAAAAATAS